MSQHASDTAAPRVEEIERLESQIQQRRDFLLRLWRLVPQLARERGTLLHSDQGEDWTHAIHALYGIPDFSFYSDSGRRFNSPEIRIYHHPGRMLSAGPDPKDLVFSGVFREGLREDEVVEIKVFEVKRPWQTAIEDFIRNKDKIFTELDAERRRLMSQEEAGNERTRKMAELQAQAKRLRLL